MSNTITIPKFRPRIIDERRKRIMELENDGKPYSFTYEPYKGGYLVISGGKDHNIHCEIDAFQPRENVDLAPAEKEAEGE